MNAILALCSFCEVDGPTVLLCTQTYHTRPGNGDSISTHTDTDESDENSPDIVNQSAHTLVNSTPGDECTENKGVRTVTRKGRWRNPGSNAGVSTTAKNSISEIEKNWGVDGYNSGFKGMNSDLKDETGKAGKVDDDGECGDICEEVPGVNSGSNQGPLLVRPSVGISKTYTLYNTGGISGLNGDTRDSNVPRNTQGSTVSDVFGGQSIGVGLRMNTSPRTRAHAYKHSSGTSMQPTNSGGANRNMRTNPYFDPYGEDENMECVRDLDERSVFMGPFGTQRSHAVSYGDGMGEGRRDTNVSYNDKDSFTGIRGNDFPNRHSGAHLDGSMSPQQRARNVIKSNPFQNRYTDMHGGLGSTVQSSSYYNTLDDKKDTNKWEANRENEEMQRTAGTRPREPRSTSTPNATGAGMPKIEPTPVDKAHQATRLTNPVTGDGTRVMLPIFQPTADLTENDSTEVSEEFRTFERIQAPDTNARAKKGPVVQRCNACNLLRPNCPGYFSKDSGTGVEYVSTPAPLNSKLFTIVRKVCVRSLSIEMLPGREGPAVFGDTQNGYVLQYQFTLKDPQARGFRRIYSIVFLMTDLSYLMNSFQFLTAQFRLLVNHLKQQADISSSRPLSNADHHQNARLRSQSHQTQLPSRSRQRPTPASLKSLDELTNTMNMASRLHQTFSWILNSCATRLVELPTGGPRQVTTGMWNVNKKDNHFIVASKVVLSNTYHKVVEAFISSCPYIIGPDLPDRSPDSETGAQTDTGSGSASDSNDIRTLEHRRRSSGAVRGSKDSLNRSLGGRFGMGMGIVGSSRDINRIGDIGADSIDSLQLMSSRSSIDGSAGHSHVLRKPSEVSEISNAEPLMSEAIPILLTAAQVGQALSRHALRVILYQMLIGNQLIVRGECEEIVISVLFSLAYLLPRDCCTMVPYSHIYRERWECNFLGLSADAEIPATLDHGSHVILDVKYNPKPIHKKKACNHGNPPNSAPSGERSTPLICEDITLRVFKSKHHFQRSTFNRTQSDIELIGADGFFHVPHGARAQSMVPSMRTHRASIPYPLPEAADSCLLANEILRVLTDNSYSEAVKHQYLISLKEEWFNKAKVFLRFAKTHPKATDVQTLTSLLKALRCGTSDLPVLRFWVEALSREDRDIILNKAGPCKSEFRRSK